MRPIELTIEGFTSFRNKATINFENLELFAITGPTGAGKSSILDAMTLALYGKISKFNATSPKDLLSQGASKLQISLRFIVGNNQYQVLRSWSFQNKTTKPSFSLQKLVSNRWESLGEHEKAIENIISKDLLKMDFETFTKVIFLPQGKFDEFLKVEPRKRREILRELTGFQIFESMREKASEEFKKLNSHRDVLIQHLENLELDSNINIDDLCKKLEEFDDQLPKLFEDINLKKTALKEEKKLLEDLNSLDELKQKLVNLEKQKTAINDLQQILDNAQIHTELLADWKMVDFSRNRYNETINDFESASLELSNQVKLFNSQDEKLKEVKIIEAKKRPQLEQKKDNLRDLKNYEEQVLQINPDFQRAKDDFSEANKSLDNIQLQVKKAEADLKERINELNLAIDLLAQYSSGGSRLDKLTKILPFLGKFQEIQKQVNQFLLALRNIVQKLENADKNYEQALINLQKTKKEKLELDLALNIATQKNQALALRESLHTGDNCLVCGGVYPDVHLLPKIQSSSLDLKLLKENYQKIETEYQNANSVITRVETEIKGLKNQKNECEKDLTQKEIDLQNEKIRISELLGSDQWKVSLIEQEYQELNQSDAKYQKYLKVKEEAQDKVKEIKYTLNNFKITLLDKQKNYKKADENVKRINIKHQEILKKIDEITNGESYDDLSKKIENDQKSLDELIKITNESYNSAKELKIQAEQKDRSAKEQFDKASKDKILKEKVWQTILLSKGFTELKFKESFMDSADQQKIQQNIKEYNDQKLEIKNLIKQISNIVGERITNDETIAQYVIDIEDAEGKRHSVQKDRNDLDNKIRIIQQNQDQQKKLQSKLIDIQQNLDIYNLLSKELKSDRFQDYLLQYFEKDLAMQATLYLKDLTQERYALNYTNSSYYVIDNWNCGESRLVKTLSGGETFATSLSLALALSEKLSRGIKIGCLFIDEGFGTLDTETLQNVTNILQGLGQQDKLVGVITHVSELGEELGTQIKVEKFSDGSRIVQEKI